MSKSRLEGNREKNGTQRDVNSSLPEVELPYSSAIYFIYIIYKYLYFAHDSTVTAFSGQVKGDICLWRGLGLLLSDWNITPFSFLIKCIFHVHVFILFFFFFFFFFWQIYIFFYYTTKSLSLVGGRLFRSGLCLGGGGGGGGGGLCVGLVGVSGDSCCGCGLYSESDSDSESSSSLWEALKLNRLNIAEFLVTWWFPLCIWGFFI